MNIKLYMKKITEQDILIPKSKMMNLLELAYEPNIKGKNILILRVSCIKI